MLRKLLKNFDRRTGLRNRLRGLPSAGFDLGGEKVLDWGWCMAHLPPQPPQQVLDVGCVQAPLTPAAVTMGHIVTGIDTDRLNYSLPNFTFYQADFMEVDLGASRFDAVVLCSVVEHIGLAGRYDQREQPDGDLHAMRKVAQLLRPDGRLILTIPVGVDMVFKPWHRIYGTGRLSLLMQGYVIVEERYLVKQLDGVWQSQGKQAALQVNRGGLSYALGQFVLKLA
jgi:2-polyprenyl-3-methyl-5-hydroxy-6-metoxy-1,4-benzoquinol methylase